MLVAGGCILGYIKSLCSLLNHGNGFMEIRSTTTFQKKTYVVDIP